MKKKNENGFTLVEIMIVVAIIGILAAIAIPHWRSSVMRANSKSCINNLRIMEDSKQQFALEFKKALSDSYTLEDLTIFLRNPDSTVCPSTQDPYVVNIVREFVTCPNYSSFDPEFSTHLIEAK